MNEFELIARLTRSLPANQQVIVGAGDDCAVIGRPRDARWQLLKTDVVIDLRSLTEAPVSPFAAAFRIDVDTVESARPRFPRESRIVLCCRTGVRAWRAARALQAQGHENVALITLGD